MQEPHAVRRSHAENMFSWETPWISNTPIRSLLDLVTATVDMISYGNDKRPIATAVGKRNAASKDTIQIKSQAPIPVSSRGQRVYNFASQFSQKREYAARAISFE